MIKRPQISEGKRNTCDITENIWWYFIGLMISEYINFTLFILVCILYFKSLIECMKNFKLSDVCIKVFKNLYGVYWQSIYIHTLDILKTFVYIIKLLKYERV